MWLLNTTLHTYTCEIFLNCCLNEYIYIYIYIYTHIYIYIYIPRIQALAIQAAEALEEQIRKDAEEGDRNREREERKLEHEVLERVYLLHGLLVSIVLWH